MKLTATKEIAAHIDEIQGKLNTGGNGHRTKALYDELTMLLDEYNTFDIVFEENGKKGLKDIAGRVRVPAVYEGFAETYAYTFNRKRPVPALNGDGMCALVTTDGTGVPLCGFEYDYIEFMFASDGYYRCEKVIDGKTRFGILNAQGELLIPCEMDVVHAISNSFSGIVKDGKVGLLTTSGVYIAPVFDDLDEDGEFVKACKDGVWGYISARGEFIDMADEERLEEEELLCLFEY